MHSSSFHLAPSSLFFTLDSGPPGTAYEGAVLPGILTFPKDYPLLPPKVRLVGQVFHPNGNVILRIMVMKWARAERGGRKERE